MFMRSSELYNVCFISCCLCSCTFECVTEPSYYNAVFTISGIHRSAFLFFFVLVIYAHLELCNIPLVAPDLTMNNILNVSLNLLFATVLINLCFSLLLTCFY